MVVRAACRFCLAALLALGAFADKVPADCVFTAATNADAGLLVGATVLLPEGPRPGHGVHVRINGKVGAVAPFDDLLAAYPDAAALDCRDAAVLSPGFVNAHEHPAYSYAFPHPDRNPGYEHRDEWRFGLNGKPELTVPEPMTHVSGGDPAATARLVAMELRHLVGGATLLAGPGGMPGVIRNVGLQESAEHLALYDAEADMDTFPFSFRALEELAPTCAAGQPMELGTTIDGTPAYAAHVAHVGEGRASNCVARQEVARFLELARQGDRRYSLVHGVATSASDFEAMREHDVTLVWSPRSNFSLYGETVDIGAALDSGVRMALATDWSPSGSFTMKEEATCARRAAAKAGVALPWRTLWRMATLHGAYALGLEARFGAILAGAPADMVLLRSASADPYQDVFEAPDHDILASWIGGEVVLAAAALEGIAPASSCVALAGLESRVCGILGPLGLTPSRFAQLTADSVPLNDMTRQAPCDPDA
ncbi:MAG: amidohydrolase family protein [Gammaproteobacteria bacterium]|nr:amidohydrolase family protein [Gammaproteobacteria bacterium]